MLTAATDNLLLINRKAKKIRAANRGIAPVESAVVAVASLPDLAIFECVHALKAAQETSKKLPNGTIQGIIRRAAKVYNIPEDAIKPHTVRSRLERGCLHLVKHKGPDPPLESHLEPPLKQKRTPTGSHIATKQVTLSLSNPTIRYNKIRSGKAYLFETKANHDILENTLLDRKQVIHESLGQRTAFLPCPTGTRTQAALRGCAIAISHPSKDVVHLGIMLWVKYEEGCTTIHFLRWKGTHR
jgi:hypothetical protein